VSAVRKVDLGTMPLGGTLSGPVVVSLEEGEFLRLSKPQGTQVLVESGRLWITQPSRNEDVWLQDGERTELQEPGPALVEAVRMTRLRIEQL
jgi:hypothetical protein